MLSGDIDTAVESYTAQSFREATENRCYEPEPVIIYCARCGDEAVPEKGFVCAHCSNPETIAEDLSFAEYLRQIAEGQIEREA